MTVSTVSLTGSRPRGEYRTLLTTLLHYRRPKVASVALEPYPSFIVPLCWVIIAE